MDLQKELQLEAAQKQASATENMDTTGKCAAADVASFVYNKKAV